MGELSRNMPLFLLSNNNDFLHCVDVFIIFFQLLEASAGRLVEYHHNWFDDTPFVARYVRMNPQHWVNNMCLRVEVFGCDTGKHFPS